MEELQDKFSDPKVIGKILTEAKISPKIIELVIKMGNIQIPGSKALTSPGNLILSENTITSAGNIPKIIVNDTIIKVGKNIIQESS